MNKIFYFMRENSLNMNINCIWDSVKFQKLQITSLIMPCISEMILRIFEFRCRKFASTVNATKQCTAICSKSDIIETSMNISQLF